MSEAVTVRDKLRAIIDPRSGATLGERTNAAMILEKLTDKPTDALYTKAVELIDRYDPSWHPEGWRSPYAPAQIGELPE